MYLPSQFEEKRPEVLRQLMREHPLGTLVTVGRKGLSADHVPQEFDPEPAPFGTLRCHLARANPAWREHAKEAEALVIFHGPSTYISPSLYPSKQETGKVVPTYNYAVVHAYGRMRIVEDALWLRGLVDRLTRRHEAARAQPWNITDAPQDYIESMLRAIVGIEIPITRIEGKWKMSQNRAAPDVQGVVQGLASADDAEAVAVSRLVRAAHISAD